MFSGFVQQAPCNHGADGIESCSNCEVKVKLVPSPIDEAWSQVPPFRKDPLLRFDTFTPRDPVRPLTDYYKAYDEDMQAMTERFLPGLSRDNWPTPRAIVSHVTNPWDPDTGGVRRVYRHPSPWESAPEVLTWTDPSPETIENYTDGTTPEQVIQPRAGREITDWMDTIIEGDWFYVGWRQFMITGFNGSEFSVRRLPS
jgi:hypothetical protein